jgi:hypothetical protein
MTTVTKKPFRKSNKSEKVKKDKTETGSIQLLPKSAVKEIVMRQSEQLTRTIAKLNRFGEMVNSFEKKALSCNIYGI